MDEAEFVRFLKSRFPFPYGVGIGDDTSVVKTGGDTPNGEPPQSQLITKDLFIEGVHFSLDYYSLEEAALKSLAVNISDIAAMGGEPLYFYLGLGFPATLPKERVTDIFKGLEKGCRLWNVALAGGDFSSAPALLISITMVGKAERPIYRNGAENGDLIGITGVTGESALGLKLLQQGKRSGHLVNRHKNAAPEVKKGRILAPLVNAMLDVSDGLMIDLNRILAASDKGARVAYEKIPVTETMRNCCRENGWNEYKAVLAGGEDYALLFTISREKEKELCRQKIDYFIIGEILDTPGPPQVTDNGVPIPTEAIGYGYDHFKH